MKIYILALSTTLILSSFQIFSQGSSISGSAFHDLNANGIQDGGDPPLDGITFSLRDGLTGEYVLDLNSNFIESVNFRWKAFGQKGNYNVKSQIDVSN